MLKVIYTPFHYNDFSMQYPDGLLEPIVFEKIKNSKEGMSEVIYTGSEFCFTIIRSYVARKVLDPSEVEIIFIDKQEKKHNLKIEIDGQISSFPPGWRDFRSEIVDGVF